MQDVGVILTIELGSYTRCVKPYIIMLENARSVILHELINDRLCMNLVNATQ